MNRISWSRYLLAAALVLIVGAVFVLAEEIEMKVEVKKTDNEEVTVDINGVSETIRLEDLADGEQRTFDVGDHQIIVKRIDDQLTLVHDGDTMAKMHHMGGHGNMVWVTDGEEGPHEGHRVVIVKDGVVSAEDASGDVMFFGDDMHESAHGVYIMKTGDGDVDIEALKEKFGEDFGELHGEHDVKMLTVVGEGHGDHPLMVERMGFHGGGDHVAYRCEESGSMLIVKADDTLLDDYIDPVSGCLMKKVEHTGGPKVITIRKEIKEGCDVEE